MSHWHPAYPVMNACLFIASPVILAGTALYLAYVGITAGAAYAKNNLFKSTPPKEKDEMELLEPVATDNRIAEIKPAH